MDISALSTGISAVNLQNDIGVALLSKSLDTVEVLGEGMVEMLESSVNPNVGQNIDILV